MQEFEKGMEDSGRMCAPEFRGMQKRSVKLFPAPERSGTLLQPAILPAAVLSLALFAITAGPLAAQEEGSLKTTPASSVQASLPAAVTAPSGSGDAVAFAPAAQKAAGRETDIPIMLNSSVEAYLAFFTTRGRNLFQQWLNNSAPYLDDVRDILQKEHLPPELAYLAMIESGFDPEAVSRANARGPWQFMPATARRYGLRKDRWVDERKDLEKSTRAAARYLRDLHDRFGSWSLVIAAYNAGRGKIDRALQRTGGQDFWDLRTTRSIRGETKGFVPKFLAAVIIARNPAAYGFRPPHAKPHRYDEVALWSGMDLGVAAYCAGTTSRVLRRLNPELIGTETPPDVVRFLLKIPAGRARLFSQRRAALLRSALRTPNAYPLPVRRPPDNSRGIHRALAFITSLVGVQTAYAKPVEPIPLRSETARLADARRQYRRERPATHHTTPLQAADTTPKPPDRPPRNQLSQRINSTANQRR